MEAAARSRDEARPSRRRAMGKAGGSSRRIEDRPTMGLPAWSSSIGRPAAIHERKDNGLN